MSLPPGLDLGMKRPGSPLRSRTQSTTSSEKCTPSGANSPHHVADCHNRTSNVVVDPSCPFLSWAQTPWGSPPTWEHHDGFLINYRCNQVRRELEILQCRGRNFNLLGSAEVLRQPKADGTRPRSITLPRSCGQRSTKTGSSSRRFLSQSLRVPRARTTTLIFRKFLTNPWPHHVAHASSVLIA
jgi:hypothetical protein